MELTIVGWHLNADAGTCSECENAAAVIVPEDGYNGFQLCNVCLGNHTVVQDQIGDAFLAVGIDPYE